MVRQFTTKLNKAFVFTKVVSKNYTQYTQQQPEPILPVHRKVENTGSLLLSKKNSF